MRKVFEKSLFSLIFLFFWNAVAIAETTSAEIGGTKVTTVSPETWCMFDSNNLVDAWFIGIMRDVFRQTGNIFVIAYAECSELERWRTGGNNLLNNYAIVTYADEFREFVYPGTEASFVSEISQTMEKLGKEYLNAIPERVIEIVEDYLPGMVEMGKPTILGVVGEDRSSVYLGGIMPLKTMLNDLKVMTFTAGITLLNRKIVFTYLYSSDMVYSGLLEKHRNWIAKLRVAN